MLRFSKLILFINSFILFYGCKTNSLLPQAHNTPMFTDKYQTKVNATVGLKSLELQTAYAPTNYFGFMVNGLYPVNSGPKEMEAAIGIFNKRQESSKGLFDKDKIIAKHQLIYELYAGAGHGSVVHTYENTQIRFGGKTSFHDKYDVSMNGNKVFLQADIGMKFKNKINMKLILSIRASYWNYTNFYYHHQLFTKDYYNNTDTLYHLQSTDSTNFNHPQSLMCEPSVTFMFGGRNVNVLFQVGALITLNQNNTSFINSYTDTWFTSAFYLPIYARVGVSISLPFTKKETRNKSALIN